MGEHSLTLQGPRAADRGTRPADRGPWPADHGHQAGEHLVNGHQAGEHLVNGHQAGPAGVCISINKHLASGQTNKQRAARCERPAGEHLVTRSGARGP